MEIEKVFVPSFNLDIRRAPKLGEIFKAPDADPASSDDDGEEETSSVKQTYDVHKYLSFELEDGTDEETDDLPKVRNKLSLIKRPKKGELISLERKWNSIMSLRARKSIST